MKIIKKKVGKISISSKEKKKVDQNLLKLTNFLQKTVESLDQIVHETDYLTNKQSKKMYQISR
jgi:hypothetical protein